MQPPLVAQRVDLRTSWPSSSKEPNLILRNFLGFRAGWGTKLTPLRLCFIDNKALNGALVREIRLPVVNCAVVRGRMVNAGEVG
jgi:hypothetical protein